MLNVGHDSTIAFERRARERLSFDLPPRWADPSATRLLGGDHRLDDLPPRLDAVPRAAAVLIPILARAAEPTILLTLRAASLRVHSGQIAFPGGSIDASDADPMTAALREAQEEVGLDPACVTPLGYLDPYLTGTGFLIVPTVAMVHEPFDLELNAAEVVETFEVPLAFLMEEANHQRSSREWNGRTRSFYAMPYGERYIWGITAGMIRSLYEKLYR
ncbi:CoA pyrophosphatase [Lichenihabitans psoromatis]|uniref:CoA pyrophosphatase n=1 Tax=Lichenihabitans psoromatis TaxID=2528642 RepID=UPI0010365E53|nr:CoA pyrophosphatase [Lichenihabitans psoromatis]